MDKQTSWPKWLGIFGTCLICAVTYGILTATADHNVKDIASNTQAIVANTSAINEATKLSAKVNMEVIGRLSATEAKIDILLKRSE